MIAMTTSNSLNVKPERRWGCRMVSLPTFVTAEPTD
jgi:hypothetical protein